MPYLIEGKILWEEKPEKYMDRFIDFTLLKKVEGRTTEIKRWYVATSSERLANFLNRVGYNFQWNDDLEVAQKLCERKAAKVSETKLFDLYEGWKDYLNGSYKDTSEYRILQGELRLWKEMRIPSPWLYLYSSGELKEVFVFDGNRFSTEPLTEYAGQKHTVGFLIDAPALHFEKSRTKTHTTRTRYNRVRL